ncbi:putative RAB6-interacting protein [Tripterygium wilfordii]|uniref:Putative RAB6-interacting protein n=2 Tax=Tripterygium wilfordii TaxID=458696 RepID=A0A7J7DDV5_TRIWF|nr:protein NETWORKED 4B isoform X2 [Tripterygium wilfordii]KAF5744438.1 putative RAB6-interacting protein [Tripterygium wilfordii]
MRRMESKKSHSWWWDSHISPKNSKWLAENLEEMDHNVKRMLKLIEEDADSFAKKAEMYYKKRPELISLVEDFYRMYRSLAERYDQVTGELRKNIPSDLQSQGSGISDIGSEVSSTCPSPDHRRRHRKSGSRAAGFDFFLGSRGSANQKEDDDSSSSTDFESESDGSSVNKYSNLAGNGADTLLQKRIVELEIEIRELKEKLQMQQEENEDSSYRGSKNANSEEFLSRIAAYEQDLKNANEKIRLSEDEIVKLKIEVQKYKSSRFTNGFQADLESSTEKNRWNQEAELELEMEEAAEPQDSDSTNQALIEELRITKDRLESSKKEIFSLKKEVENNINSEIICNLQVQIESAKKDIASWKVKLNTEKREVTKLHERITRLKSSVSDRDNEIQDLKIAVSDAERKIFPEKAEIKAEISKLLEERTLLEEQVREWESRGRCLEDDVRKVQAEKSDREASLNLDIKQLKTDIKHLNKSISALQLERSQLNGEVVALKGKVVCRDDRIDEMNKHLHQLHMEHVQLIAGAERAHKLADELRSKAEELEKEVERQKVVILEGAEEKREAIRQLCFSLEHYRNGYEGLRKAFIGHKRVPVLAS